MPEPNRITLLLGRVRRGDRAVVDELMPVIYDELRSLAQRHLRAERPDHTLQATALVNEAYVRLIGSDSGPWQDRAHFFAVAATVVRRLLVEHARTRHSDKRGGRRQRVPLDEVDVGTAAGDDRVLAVDEALQRLARLDPQKARLVELRFFGALTVDETAEALGVSPRTVAREWDFVRAWLTAQLREVSDDD